MSAAEKIEQPTIISVSPKALVDFKGGNRIAFIGNLADSFDFKFFGVSVVTHKHLFYAIIYGYEVSSKSVAIH